MIDKRMVVDMAAAIDVIQAVKQGFAMIAGKAGGDIVTRQARAERHGMRVVDRALGLLDANGAQVKGLWIFLLQLQMGNVRVCCQPCTRYRIGQARAAALPDVMPPNKNRKRVASGKSVSVR